MSENIPFYVLKFRRARSLFYMSLMFSFVNMLGIWIIQIPAKFENDRMYYALFLVLMTLYYYHNYRVAELRLEIGDLMRKLGQVNILQ